MSESKPIINTSIFTVEPSFEDLIPKFADFLLYDERLAQETVSKYQQALSRLLKDLSYITHPSQLTLADIVELKKIMIQRGVGSPGINSAVFALRKFLAYCRQIYKIAVINPKEIQRAKLQTNEVVYLIQDEIKSFLKTMNVKTLRGLRMRTLVQTLLATGMRISEALSLNRNDIDWDARQAVVIGKGNKPRTIYFSPAALEWLKRYFSGRKDDNPALFVTFGPRPKRLKRSDLSKSFKHYAALAGIKKRVSAHVMRHSFATLLTENGAPLHHIQRMLGHADLKTTAKYYLGADREAIKSSHEKYLRLI